MLIVGLTGGIASGKTTATEFFSSLGVPVYDADLIVHDLLKQGTTSYTEIINFFGAGIVQDDGELNRKKLRQIIFSDKQKRQQLESILHPKVRTRLKNNIAEIKMAETNTAYCIVCIPLLVETHQQDLVQRILLIDIPKELQIERLKKRDNLSANQINDILAAQATREERLALADDVIVNNLDIEHFEKQLIEIHKNFLSLA